MCRHNVPNSATREINAPRSFANPGCMGDTPIAVDAATVKGFKADLLLAAGVTDTAVPVADTTTFV